MKNLSLLAVYSALFFSTVASYAQAPNPVRNELNVQPLSASVDVSTIQVDFFPALFSLEMPAPAQVLIVHSWQNGRSFYTVTTCRMEENLLLEAAYLHPLLWPVLWVIHIISLCPMTMM